MSLATRCVSCNTVFRVVQDQLKVSEGWVRCGRCHEVFNALESLFDLEPAASSTTVSAPPTDENPTARAEPEASSTSDLAEPVEVAADTWVPAPADSPIDTPINAPINAPVNAPIDAPQEAAADAPPMTVYAETAAAPDTPAVPSAEPFGLDDPAGALADAGFHALARVAVPDATTTLPPPDAGDEYTQRPTPAVADDTPASRLDARDRHDFADARFNSEMLAEEGIGMPDDAPDDVLDDSIDPDPAAAIATQAAPTQAPGFLRRAEQRARWNRPAVVVAVSLLCGVLLLGLAAQAAYHFRDLTASTWPATRPTLEALCEHAGCRIEPLRRIDDIVIESSALTGAPVGDAVRLSVVLRNRGTLALAMPAIELTLTDVGGQMLARRALSPTDFGVGRATLPAASETPLQLVLAVSGRRPSGYTVEPFYP